MISTLGSGLVLVALLCATIGSLLGFRSGMTGSATGWTQTQFAALGFAASMILANLLMVYALVTHDFSVAYVAEVGSRSTPTYYTVISLWSSLNGSILFWGAILGVYVIALTTAHARTHREYMPYTLGVLLAVSVFFSLLVSSVANPFAAVEPLPDGPGPNPLLQNHWLMAYHPPTLYLGYVGMAVPFAMCCAALLAGRLEAGWIAQLRRWLLIPWVFLTLGITMGGWWSYEVLGWGGYWAWDPVENASFLPWLTGTAFLHSAMVVERRGALKTWTLILGMSTFLLTMLGTFMTRSGVFNSVHSFTQSEIGPVFLWFIAICFVCSVLLLGLRDHKLHGSDNPAWDESLGDTGEKLSVFALIGKIVTGSGREIAILLQNLLFSLFTFTVLLGVLYPLIAESLFERKVSVGEPYFDRFALPIGLAIVSLMGVGPALPWGTTKRDLLLKKFAIPVVAAAVATAVWAWTSGENLWGWASAESAWAWLRIEFLPPQHPYVLLSIAVCTFAFVANLNEFIEPVWVRVRARKEGIPRAVVQVTTRARRRFGGHIAHYGVISAVIAIAMSKGYRAESDAMLQIGEVVTVGAWSATFEGAEVREEPHRQSRVAKFHVRKNDKDLGLLEPKLNQYQRMPEPIGTPAVYETLTGDFYLS